MILVAGGAGRLGRELVTLLRARGAPLRVLSRDAGCAAAALSPGVEVIQGDVRDPKTIAGALKGVDVVVSAVTGFGPGGSGTRSVDEEGNANLITAAEAAGVQRFVLVSVEQAAPDHPMELMRRKHAAEEWLRRSTMTWTIVRPAPFAELWSGIVGEPIRAGRTTTVFGRGDNPINFVAAADVAGIVVRAVFDRGLSEATIRVGGPDHVSLNQLVAMIEGAVGHRARARHIPVGVLRFASAVLRPFRPDLAGLMEAAVCLDERDMTFELGALTARFPEHRPTPIADVVGACFSGSSGAGGSADPRDRTPVAHQD